MSPTDTSSTATSSGALSHSSRKVTSHWAMKVFDEDLPATVLPRSGENSTCYGPHMHDAKTRLEDEYTQLFQLSFSGGDLVTRLYLRGEDHRARIFCKTTRQSGRSKLCCLPLSSLEILRVDSSLQLLRVVRGSKPELWANLKFTTYERLCLYFCSFIALRSQDLKRTMTEIRDHDQDIEEELFGGKIIDDHFEHGLRLYRDTQSRGVRLQASVLNGELKNMPVWTAFITHQIVSRDWLKIASQRVIHLGELKRYVFSPDYTPQRTSRGEAVLNFKTVGGRSHVPVHAHHVVTDSSFRCKGICSHHGRSGNFDSAPEKLMHGSIGTSKPDITKTVESGMDG